jgi:hypothetical protein
MVDIKQTPLLPLLACGLMVGGAIAAPSCVPDFDVSACGVVCPDSGVVEGNASISGIVSVDAFFGAVIDLRRAALDVSGTVRAELEGIAASLGIVGYAELSLSDLTAEIRVELDETFSEALDGGIEIHLEPVKCETSLDLAVEAAARCDATVDPSVLEAKCEGWCEVSAEVAADCETSGALLCVGQAPDFACEGSCSGACQLQVAAACEGTCEGTCDGACSSCTGGACNVDLLGHVTNCNGSCDAMCEGTCQLSAGGGCAGRCEGECAYMPASGGCGANATFECDVSAMPDAECQGKCENSVEPPSVSAECEAAVAAEIAAHIECAPPSLSVQFTFAASLDADERAEFRIWLDGFEARFSALLAASAKLDRVGVAAQDLITDARGAVAEAFEGIRGDGSLSLQSAIGIACAGRELERVGAALDEATSAITGSVSAVGSIAASVGS